MTYKKILNSKWSSLEKLEQHHTKRIENIKRNTRSYYDLLKFKADEKSKLKYDKRYEKKVAQKIRIEQEKYRVAQRMIKGWKVTEKKEVIGFKKMKTMAFNKFQLYCRLSRCDNDWFLTLIDSWKRVHYKKAQWWHYFSKKNYPWIAFDTDNCRPISWITNKLQSDQEGLFWQRNLISHIWYERFDALVSRSRQKEHKILTIDYYRDMFDNFDTLVVKEKNRLWIM